MATADCIANATPIEGMSVLLFDVRSNIGGNGGRGLRRT